MTDRTGQQFGNYRLLRLLGRGGFAEVYLGQHLRLASQQAAVKILSTHLDEADIQAFEREAETVASLVHPHIVRVLDFDVTEGIPFLVMDYAPNGSLRQRHRLGEQLPLAIVLSYIEQIASGLHYAHEQKRIHRDIKPDNMLIGRRGEILLSDFGIATIAHGTTSQSTQAAIGTIPYMAPEQMQEHPRPASDQYALAITAYEWLLGERPFNGSFTEIAVKHAMMPPPPLRAKRPELSPAIEQVVLTALAKDPKARFSNVQEFATALNGANVAASSAEATMYPPVPPTQNALPPTVLAQPARRETVGGAADTPLPPQITQPDPSLLAPLTFSPTEAATLTSPDTQTIPPNPSPAKKEPAKQSVSRRAVITTGVAAAGVVVVGGGFGIYGVVTGNWPWVSWHSQNSGTSQQLRDIAWSGSQFVAVGDVNTIVTSPDGHAWTAQNPGSSVALYAVSWSGSQFVAVGGEGLSLDPSSKGTILTSPDGRAWTAQNPGTSVWLSGVVCSSSLCVAVGGGTIVTSPDGFTWSAQNLRTSGSLLLNSVVRSSSLCVAVGGGGTIVTSPDGLTWSAQTSGTGSDLADVVWSGSQFVAVGNGGTILTSPDGRTWTVQTSSTESNLADVIWSGSQFVAVGGEGAILTSSDGRTWTTQNSGRSVWLDSVAWSGLRFVAVGNNGTILTSP